MSVVEVQVSDAVKTRTEFATLLTFDALDEGVFEAAARTQVREPAFGRARAAQALVAAARTVSTDRAVHSVHCHFLRAGDTTAPTKLVVTSLRDGRSYSTRSVIAEQHGKPIFAMTAAFHVEEEGWEHQTAVMESPDPESLPTLRDRGESIGGKGGEWLTRLADAHALDVRFGENLPRDGNRDPSMSFWFRCLEDLHGDNILHAGVMLYVSDLMMLSTALRPHEYEPGGRKSDNASLDHAVWIHQTPRADEWLRYEMAGPWAGRGRALVDGRIFNREGTLIATVVQEGMARLRPEF